MSALLDELVLEQGETVTGRLSGALGISREQASRVLPATGDVILDRFEPCTCGRGGTDPHPVEADTDPALPLDGILAGTGLQLSERLGLSFGILPEEAARTIPLLVPAILRFILRRTPFGSLASSDLSRRCPGKVRDLSTRWPCGSQKRRSPAGSRARDNTPSAR
jgi:hypothetical protein